MLLAPANANSWSCRVKRIIFDEIHCIGQVEDGVVWEQLLLLAPCPIIALSATVGNPQEFSQWLGTTQKANGMELTTIEHRHRYSDLRKYVYNSPKKFHFNGLPKSVPFAPIGLDNALGMAFLHPVACIVDRSRGMPVDLTLEARDCWMLWKAMTKYQTPDFPVDESLDPAVALPSIIRKVDIVGWEAKLKRLLKSWIQDLKSPYGLVWKELGLSPRRVCRPEVQVSPPRPKQPEGPRNVLSNNYVDTALPLVCSLHEQGALPAIFFNYDRSGCEAICDSLLTQLEKAEGVWKESSLDWKSTLAGWEAWKTSQERQAKKNAATDAKKPKGGNDNMSREDRMQENAKTESSLFKLFNPDAPVDGFHLADVRKLTPSEFDEHAKELKRRSVSKWLIMALRRGIGVHHAGINSAGRAGRRGFDMLGNVVFNGVPYSKVCRLLSSRLPDLNGHFPITTSLVLRLFTLLHESKEASNAVKMVNSLLSCPHIYLGGGEAQDTVLHHLRFSIEYLRRSHLLGPEGAPLNFAGCVSHLYFVENSSFAFHTLLKDGYFHDLCSDINHATKAKLLALMLVMSHLFGRLYLRPAILENRKQAAKKSTSMIVLPPMPLKPAKLLRGHNQEILQIYSAYVKTFVDQHVTEPDCNLPLTRMQCGGSEPLENGGIGSPPPVRYTSAFYALSGHRDEWKSVPDLCKTVRSGVWLEKAVVPYVGLYPEEGKVHLNAYLYDFFKHGNVHILEKDNGIRRGDIWFLLNDFSLVLATIMTSFENFVKLSPGTDTDMLDIMGSGDTHEEELDVVATQDGTETGGSRTQDLVITQTSSASASFPAPTVTRKKMVAESWEDKAESDENDEDNNNSSELDKSASRKKNTEKEKQQLRGPVPAWGGKDDGISNVLRGFKLLQAEFNQKFKETWA